MVLDEIHVYEEILSQCEVVIGDRYKISVVVLPIPLGKKPSKPVVLLVHLLQMFYKKILRQIVFNKYIYESIKYTRKNAGIFSLR